MILKEPPKRKLIRAFANHLFFIINFHESLMNGLTGYLPYSERPKQPRLAEMPLTLWLHGTSPHCLKSPLFVVHAFQLEEI